MKYLQKFSIINRLAHWNALISLIVGTLLLLLYMITQNSMLIDLGIYYLGIVFWWNCIVLLTVIVMQIIHKNSWTQTAKTIAALLLNIPIAFLYFLTVIAIEL